MTLRLYDFRFNLLGTEKNVIMARWIVYYNGIGTFEVHLPITSELVDVVMENTYLVAVQNGFSAIIVGKELSDELVLYGRTCNWLLSKRLVGKLEKTAVIPGNYATELALQAFSDTENFVSGSFEDSSEMEFEHNEGYAEDAIANCLDLVELGHEVVFDIKNRKWVFNVIKGHKNDLVLSEGHRNAYSAKGTFDILDLVTCGIYEEDTDDGKVKKQVDKYPDKTGIYRWERRLFCDNETEALSELSALDEQKEITLAVRNLEFGRDYNLGDTVRVQIIKGNYRKTQNRKIKGVEVRFEQGVHREQPIFE